MPRDVVAINLSRRIAKLDDGIIVPITTMYDDDSEQTEDHEACVVFVCGSDTLGSWFTGRVDGFVSA